MNIVVFGASGRTGLEVVKQALEAGHTVTAFVRNASKLTGQITPGERLHVIEGSITDCNAVLNVLNHQDAVIVALGPGPNAPAETTTQGLQYILIGAKTHNVRRVVVVSGAGINVPSDKKKPFDKTVSVMVRLLNGKDVEEKEKQYQMLSASGLDWTLVRPPVLTDKPKTGAYQTDVFTLNGKPQVSRADLADFLLRETVEGKYKSKPVFIGG